MIRVQVLCKRCTKVHQINWSGIHVGPYDQTHIVKLLTSQRIECVVSWWPPKSRSGRGRNHRGIWEKTVAKEFERGFRLYELLMRAVDSAQSEARALVISYGTDWYIRTGPSWNDALKRTQPMLMKWVTCGIKVWNSIGHGWFIKRRRARGGIHQF